MGITNYANKKIIIVVAIVLVAIGLLTGIRQVGTGQLAVVTRYGKVSDRELGHDVLRRRQRRFNDRFRSAPVLGYRQRSRNLAGAARSPRSRIQRRYHEAAPA